MSTITLPNIRVGSDLQVRVRLKDGGVAIDWSTLQNIKACIYSDAQRALAGRCGFSIDEEDSTLLVCTYAANKPQYLGVNRIVISAKYMGETKTYDKPAFTFVRWTADQEGEEITIDDPDVDVEIEVEDVSSSLLDQAIAAALAAAAAAEHAAHLIPNQVLLDAEAATVAANAAADAANAAGITSAQVSIADNEPGTPSAEVSLANKVLSIIFHHLKGNTGDAAGFGSITATVDDVVGDPSVTVTVSGPDTAKNFTFAFHGLRGIQGVPGVANAKYKSVDTLPTASAATMDFIYLTPSGTTGVYNMSYTEQDGSTYSWQDLGTTAIQLSDYATKAEVSQLEAKVDDLIEDLSDVTTTQTEILPTDADGSLAGRYISSDGKVFSSSSFTIWYKQFSEDTKINYAGTNNSSCVAYSDEIPIPGATADTLVKYGQGTGDFIIPAGNYLWWSGPTSTPAVTRVYKEVKVVGGLKDFATEQEVDVKIQLAEDELREELSDDTLASQYERTEAVKMRADRFSSIIVDMMQYCHGQNGMTSTDLMPVLSATTDTLTFSAENASAFAHPGPASVHFTDGTVKTVFFGVNSGNTVSKESFDTTDLTNADYVQSIHDTVYGGAGIHLSPLGYIGLGQFIADEIVKRESLKDKNWLTGFFATSVTQSEDNTKLIDADGNLVATIDTDMSAEGKVDGNNQRFSLYGPITDFKNPYGWLAQAYRISQTGNGKYLDFVFPANGEGFVEIQAALSTYGDATGNAVSVEVYADEELIYNDSLVFCQKKFTTPRASFKKNIRVRFVLGSSAYTTILIYSVNVWRMPSVNMLPVPVFDSSKTIAVLGASWTQFPVQNGGLSLYESFNEVITRPDGTTGDGYGYFPKELARVTGAVVDDWGKSGMRVDNWGLEIIDTILSTKRYDYIVIVFWLNDHNGGVALDTWASNLALLAEKCKAACVKPIILTPCRTNSDSAYPAWYQQVMRGEGLL